MVETVPCRAGRTLDVRTLDEARHTTGVATPSASRAQHTVGHFRLAQGGRSAARRRLLASWLTCLVVYICGCQREPNEAPTETLLATTSAAATPLPPVALEPQPVSEPRREAFEQALAAIALTEKLPALPPIGAFDTNRAAMVARAKSEPVFFVSRPTLAKTASEEAVALRSYLDKSDFSWRAVAELRKQLKDRKDVAREVFLPDGYLYSESPNLAFALVSQVKPIDLFDSDTLWIQRGALVMRAKRDATEGYVYLDGPETGNRVRLLHLDRLGDGEPPTTALHRDFRLLRGQVYFEQAKVRHVTDSNIVADLRYGELWIPTLLKADGATLSVQAEAVAPELVDILTLTRDRLRRKLVAVSALRGAMQAMIAEALPFDEPKTEVGQEDGKLRPEWEAAYKSGRAIYTYNEDRYPVFDSSGRPRVPQVCIDFMIDTFERASGSWWLPREANVRQRTPGRLDLSDFSRSRLRQTAYLRELAAERSDLFQVRDFAPSERIELGYKDTFFAWLSKNVSEFEAGDMIIIRGLTPWDEVEEHTHSFFVYETDPISGVPIAIAGNAGPANLWSWETEARRTPKRTVRARIRPKLEWLETFIDVSSKQPVPPAPLLAGKK